MRESERKKESSTTRGKRGGLFKGKRRTGAPTPTEKTERNERGDVNYSLIESWEGGNYRGKKKRRPFRPPEKDYLGRTGLQT